MSESPQTNDDMTVASEEPRNPSLLRRLGCGLVLALWFLLLLTPCALFYLAANGEIRLQHGEIPQPHSHPRLLISLISDQDNRGLQVMRSSAVGDVSDLRVCVETAVSYILWESNSGNQNVIYCDCYQRADDTAAWTLKSTQPVPCAQDQ